MKIKQIYTKCLAHAAYYIESNGEVAIIDPLRDVSQYIDMSNKNNAIIKYVFETHFHADFVSSHITLAEKTNAKIIYGPNANPNFEAKIADDNEIFNLGKIKIKAIHTPGHSMESTCFLLIDENEKEHSIFTGDTLFIGDVGRPDLANERVNLTKEDLAEHLYDSLRNKIMPLKDDLIIYPGHGAGSACGKKISSKTIDTLANQKKTNYALQKDMTKQQFVKEIIKGLLPPPLYFPYNVKMNMNGYKNIDTIIKNSKKYLTINEFKTLSKNNLILDVRDKSEFAKGHIPNSIFIGLNGNFAPWVGAVLKDVNTPLLIIAEKDKEQEVITRLARIGFDNVIGFLEDGFDNWKTSDEQIDILNQISANNLEEKIKTEKKLIFDTRKPGEYESEHLNNSINTPLEYLENYIDKFPKNNNFYVHCASGYRSVIACSILKSKGFNNVIDVIGGFKDIKKTNMKISKFVCTSSTKIN